MPHFDAKGLDGGGGNGSQQAQKPKYELRDDASKGRREASVTRGLPTENAPKMHGTDDDVRANSTNEPTNNSNNSNAAAIC